MMKCPACLDGKLLDELRSYYMTDEFWQKRLEEYDYNKYCDKCGMRCYKFKQKATIWFHKDFKRYNVTWFGINSRFVWSYQQKNYLKIKIDLPYNITEDKLERLLMLI